MSNIRFFKGEENGIVIEKDGNKDSIFAEQYTKAFKLIKDLLSHPSENTLNIVTFCGERGEGKTSCMLSVREQLDKEFNEYSFYKLPIIDPAFFDEEHNIIQLMLGQMYRAFEKSYNIGNGEDLNQIKEVESLAQSFQRAKYCLSQLKQPRERIYDPMEDLNSLAAAEDLKESIRILIKEFLNFYKKSVFVISIDDIDLNIEGAYEMTEQIRKYFLSNQCLLMLSLNVDQLIDVISNYLQKKAVNQSVFDSNNMASMYVTKLIPVGNRIIMPKVYDICNKQLDIYESHQDEHPKHYNSIKEAITHLIYIKTRYLFYNSKGGVSPIVPNNLRSLRHLLGMLISMEDFVNNNESEKNKHVFKAYFFQNWIHQLNKEDQKYANLLTTTDDATIINKMVVSYLSQYITDEAKSDGSLIANILKPQNYSYNISVGDVFYIIHHLEKSNVNQELRMMLFFIKSFYSIRLYEYYDIITEHNGEMFPEPQEGGEIFKSDGWFKRANVLQKLVNGAYFTFDSDDLLPNTVEGRMSRDLKLINAMKLTNLVIRELKTGMDKFEDMNEEEQTIFKNRFRTAEFFALTTKRPISRRKADQIDRMRRDYSEPFHLSDVNLGTGYIVFDVTAPFYNVLNLKYTYSRFSYLRGKEDTEDRDRFYNFALQHEWSLLRDMMKYVKLKLDNEQNEDKKTYKELVDYSEDELNKGIMKLASNATIRNGEVLSALTELMLNLRTNMHNKKDNSKLLSQFYTTIMKSDMRTYRNVGTGKPYYIQFVFLEAIIQLLKNSEQNSLLMEIYESGIDSATTTEDDVLSVFKDFFALNFKTKKKSAIQTDLGKRYPEYESRIAPSDWDKMFPDDKKSYQRSEIVSIFKDNFSIMTGKVKANDIYIEEED